MHWLAPLVVHGAHRVGGEVLQAAGRPIGSGSKPGAASMAEPSLLRDAIIYLAAAVVCVPLASALGLGSVLGYLIAGCLIGPFGLGFVSRRGVDPALRRVRRGAHAVRDRARARPQAAVELRGPVFGGGGAQLLLSALLLAGGLLLLGLPWQAALVVGPRRWRCRRPRSPCRRWPSATCCAPIGRSGFGILLFQDIAAIPLIALVPLARRRLGRRARVGWLLALKALAAIAGVVVIGRFLTRPLLR